MGFASYNYYKDSSKYENLNLSQRDKISELIPQFFVKNKARNYCYKYLERSYYLEKVLKGKY